MNDTNRLVGCVRQATDWLTERIGPFPPAAVVLGSGWGTFGDSLDAPSVIDYAAVPGFPPTGVAGHAGRLIVGRVAGTRIVALQGRFHFYEGHELSLVTLPIRVLAALGVRAVALTSASGGIRPDLRPGVVGVLSDHINLMGSNPLRGPSHEALGPRFPDMTCVYDPDLRRAAHEASTRLGRNAPSIVYASLPGPSYETPAEIRMLGILGADVVGMSTVPEAIVARQVGLRVLGLSLVTNAASGQGDGPLDHADVLAMGRASAEHTAKLLTELMPVVDRLAIA